MHKRLRLLQLTAAPAVLLLCLVLQSSLAQAPDSNSSSAQTDSASAQIASLMRGAGRTTVISQVALSPDGKSLAWTEMRQLYVAPLNDLTKPLRITAATSPDKRCSDGDPIWSPDSASLAFFSDCASDNGQADLYLSHLDSNPARRLTSLSGYVNEPAFAPDGSAIAFLYVEGATRPAGALAAMKPPAGVIGEEGIEVQRVAVVSVNGSEPVKPSFVTPANLHAYEFDWSPDSTSLAYIAANPPGENNWWTAKLYRQEIAGDAPHVVLDPVTVSGPLHGLQIAVPRWSPDGKFIAFIGGLMSDQGSTGGDVFVVSSNGGQPRDLTPGRNASPQWITWDGNNGIFISELAGGNSQLVRMDVPVSSADSASFGKPVFSIPATVGSGTFESSLSATADRSTFVFQSSSFGTPPEIQMARREGCPTCRFMSWTLSQVTHFNDGVKPFWGKTDSIEWTNDGFKIQGWLMLPRDYDPHKKYPLIVEVHGGPAAAETSRWSGRGGLGAAAFSALGYFVLMPNPRGSFGQGEAFTQANRKDFGYGDLRDILAGVDTVLKRYPIDPKRIGLTGWSYGGFMSMFAVTQTHRFRAAVAGAGISDWLSYYGENSIDEWMIPYFGASVYDDPAVYAKSSAINYIKNVSTPTLVVVGDRDGECPAPQSFEFWHALRDEHVPTELVVYPNEGHGFVNPEHRRDVLDRAVNWFAKYMPANGQ
ncbi:MAG TPA: S9 family peptidase [Terracidiphilus sp.]|nr:S9 family peptidase [Terracidiphilus sp.]